MKRLILLMLLPLAFATDVQLLNTDPYPLESGEFGKLRVKLLDSNYYEDRDFDTSTASITFIDSEALKLVDESSRTKTFTLKGKHSEDFYQLIEYDVLVGNVPEGSVEIAFRVNGNTEYVTIPIEDDNASFDIGNIQSLPKHLYPDTEDVKLEIQIANIGDKDAENVVASITSDALESASSFSARYGIGTIEESDTGTAIFYVDVPDIDPGTKELDMHISYKEGDAIREKSFSIPFVVLGKPDFSVETIHNEKVKQGESSYLKLNITNTGRHEAEEVAVDVIKDSNVLIEFERYVDFVGELQPGESGEVYLPFTASKDASIKENPVELSIRYIFNDQVHSESARQLITVEKRNQTVFENKTMMGIIVALVILASVIYHVMRGEK
ncbi:MAG: hypothetical protein R6V53_05210 [Candidatus Woesearchaeota archaeon]